MKIIFSVLLQFAVLVSAAEPIRSITVKGEGESVVAPDFVLVAATVFSEGKDVDRAKRDVDERMKDVVSRLRGFNIEADDMVFGGATVEQTYKYDRNENDIPTGFRVTREFELKLRDLNSYEQLIHALVSAGTDEIDTPISDVDDHEKLKITALQFAAENAQKKAAAIVASLDVQLGDPLEIGEDRLFPSSRFDQKYADDSGVIEEIIVTAQKRGIEDPLLFIPNEIKTKATLLIRFEVTPNQ